MLAFEIKVTDWGSSQDAKADSHRVVLFCLDVVVHVIHGEFVRHKISLNLFFRGLKVLILVIIFR